MDFDVVRAIIGVVALAFSVSFHEAAHALVADKLGDPTGRDLGRITLNPLAHIDLFNTIILPFIFILIFKVPFGMAKPVPINPYNFRNQARDFALSASAGPISNFILAALGIAVLFVLHSIAPDMIQIGSYNFHFFFIFILLNVILGVFNLIPIPPLDGSRVFRLFLPLDLREKFDRLEQFGILIVFIAIFAFDLGSVVVSPFASFARDLILKIYGG